MWKEQFSFFMGCMFTANSWLWPTVGASKCSASKKIPLGYKKKGKQYLKGNVLINTVTFIEVQYILKQIRIRKKYSVT